MRAKLLVALLAVSGCRGALADNSAVAAAPTRPDKVVHTDAEWRKILSPAAYEVMRHQGTERAFSPGNFSDDHRHAVYRCAGCNLPLFRSEDKFDSGTGWPSFTRPAASDVVALAGDNSLGIERMEVHCARCGGHLGHVFDDGPKPTGKRYCIDGVALKQELVK
jgi:peptide-methionine (R)-S-oxide reductase